jgi:hypothetical protein
VNEHKHIWHYSLITNAGEDRTTLVSYIEGSTLPRSVQNVMVRNLPYLLAGISIHDAITMNVQNIFGEDLFDADLRAKDADVMRSAEDCRLI